MRSLALALAVLAIMASAHAQELGYPYYRCEAGKSKSGVNVAGSIRQTSSSEYCFTIVDSPCSNGIAGGKCCEMKVAKFELDANSECNIDNSPITATLGGKGPLAKIDFIKPENSFGAPNANNLRIYFPDPVAQSFFGQGGRELCIKLPSAGPCNTLEKLCAGDYCTVSLTDTTHSCCPVTRFPQYSPPPPPSPSPPPPPPPPPPPSCPVCFDLTVTNLNGGDGTYKFPSDTCSKMSDVISKGMADLAAQSGATILSPFTLVNACTDNKVSVCGVIATEEDGQKIQEALDKSESLLDWLTLIIGDCDGNKAGNIFRLDIAADNTKCLQGGVERQCSLPPPPFPKRTCTKHQGASPFVLTGSLSSEPGSLPTSKWYCLGITTTEADPSYEKCSATTKMDKVEIYADDSKRGWVIATKLVFSDGTSRRFSSSWDVTGHNGLKITNLNLSLQDVQDRAPQVCFELKDLALEDLCLGDTPGVCWAALFDPSHDCCPVSWAQ